MWSSPLPSSPRSTVDRLILVFAASLSLAACGGGGGGGSSSGSSVPAAATSSPSAATSVATAATTVNATPAVPTATVPVVDATATTASEASDPAGIAAATASAATGAASTARSGLGNADPGPATTAMPVITFQPQSTIVTANQAAAFQVTATGGGTMRYQWSRNSTVIVGANGATYAIAATQLADSGAAFSVSVSNGAGSVTSAVARLTVNAVPSTGATASRPFSDQSLWNARPTGFTLGTDQIPTSLFYPVITNGQYSVAAAVASTTDPAVSVMGLSGSQGIYVADAETSVAQVTIPHWPANVTPAIGSDGHADIIDVAANMIHSFWQLSQDASGQWHAAQYTWTPLDGTGWGTPGAYQQGSRATGVVSIAGLIRAGEIDDGLPAYRHALTMSLTYNALSAAPAFVFPATTADSDAASTNSGSIPEGARLMLPAGFDASAITDPKLLKIVQTLQTYGAYVTDRNYGTPFFIYVENGANFDLMPNGWDPNVANQLDSIRAALRQIVSVNQWVDANGAVFTPNQNLNLLSMRGAWAGDSGPAAGTFDWWQQAVVFPANGVYNSQSNNGGRSVPAFIAATPAPGTRFALRASASGGASLRLTLTTMGASFDSGVLHDGDQVVLTWPAGAAGAQASVRVTSGPQGGGAVSGTLVQLPN